MTRNKVRAHQRRFEVAGSVICGVLFGVIKASTESSFGQSQGRGSHFDLLWDCTAGVACYLGAYYLIDRYGERGRWQSRPHYLFIAAGGTTLLASSLIVPDMVRSYVAHPGSDWAAMILLFALFLCAANVAGMIVMGIVCGVGLVVRSVRQ